MTTPPPDDLSDEFQAFGQNLRAVLHAAWESDERRKLQQEIERGLSGVTAALNDASQSETGQRLKADLRDLGERARTGAVEQRVRADLVSALRAINAELLKAAERAAGEKKPDDPA